jgi:hypothetical protein
MLALLLLLLPAASVLVICTALDPSAPKLKVPVLCAVAVITCQAPSSPVMALKLALPAVKTMLLPGSAGCEVCVYGRGAAQAACPPSPCCRAADPLQAQTTHCRNFAKRLADAYAELGWRVWLADESYRCHTHSFFQHVCSHVLPQRCWARSVPRHTVPAS